MIFIGDLNKADVLAALYNAAKPLGMGFLHYNPKPMTRKEAEEELKQSSYFDYLNGRVMKIEIDNQIDPSCYDRDNGIGTAERVIVALRKDGEFNSKEIEEIHTSGTKKSAFETKSHLKEETTVNELTIHLGLADVAHVLGPIVEKIIGK